MRLRENLFWRAFVFRFEVMLFFCFIYNRLWFDSVWLSWFSNGWSNVKNAFRCFIFIGLFRNCAFLLCIFLKSFNLVTYFRLLSFYHLWKQTLLELWHWFFAFFCFKFWYSSWYTSIYALLYRKWRATTDCRSLLLIMNSLICAAEF